MPFSPNTQVRYGLRPGAPIQRTLAGLQQISDETVASIFQHWFRAKSREVKPKDSSLGCRIASELDSNPVAGYNETKLPHDHGRIRFCTSVAPQITSPHSPPTPLPTPTPQPTDLDQVEAVQMLQVEYTRRSSGPVAANSPDPEDAAAVQPGVPRAPAWCREKLNGMLGISRAGTIQVPGGHASISPHPLFDVQTMFPFSFKPICW